MFENSIGANTRLLARLFAGLGLLPVLSFAQQDAVSVEDVVSRPVVEARLKEVQYSTDVPTESRDELVGIYRQTLEFIETQRSNELAAATFEQARADAPAESDRIRAEIERVRIDASDDRVDLPDSVDVSTVQQHLQQEKADQAAANAGLATIMQRLAAETDRPNLVRQRLLEARELSDRLADDLRLPAPAGQDPLLTEARRWMLSTHAGALNAEIRMLDQELLSQPMRHELLEAQRDASSASLGGIRIRVRMLEDLLAEKRRDETARLIAEAELAALGEAGKNVIVRDLVDRNRELSAHLEFLTAAIEKATADTNSATEWNQRIQQHSRTALQRMRIAGLNSTLGRVLHEQRRDLPSKSDYQRKARKRQEAVVEAGLRDIQYDAEWAELQDPAAYLDSLLGEIPESEWDTVREPLTALIAGRRTLMRNTLAANTTYIRALGEQDFEEQQLISIADEFSTFLAKRLMWVRSTHVVGPNSLKVLPQEIAAFVSADHWVDVVGALIERLVDAPALGVVLLISALLFWRAGAVKKAVRLTGQYVGNPLRDSYGATIKALGLSVLLVLPWPLITGMTGWELIRAAYTTDFTKAVGTGLITAGTFLMFLLSAKALCLDGGIAQAHFRWPVTLVNGARRELNLLLVTFMIPGIVMVITIKQHPSSVGGELSRLMFIVATIGLVNFFVKLLKPGTGLLNELEKEHDADSKLSSFWLIFGAGIPATLVVAALAGFLYSATTLIAIVVDTLWLMLGLIFAHEMVSRWLVVIRQRLVRQTRLSEWEAARAATAEQGEGIGEGEDIPLSPDEPMVDVTNLDADARKLLNMSVFIVLIIGLGAIWSPVLPALTILDNVTLWSYNEVTAGAETVVPVTLADLGMVLIILLATIFATRSIPSLLEAMLRQQGSVDAGSRLAFATLARYVLVLVGTMFIADSIGFRWSQIQWLVAALGVGIGFGLQEIIANFISGLIILMERPIRIGDIVTIGDVSGQVSRLQIRATTIINWDRQELLVPNKEFITGRVLNWTLSDEVVRLVTTVGVSYGSDMSKAMAIVREVVDENEYALDKPAPLITFDEFGDSSLNITLRCFIDSPAHRREAKSSLNLSINEKLRDAGIVVAFPQRDIHLDTAGPLDIRIQDNEDKRV